MSGWIKLYRQLQDNPLWTCEPFTRGQAWVDLLLLANHSESFFYKRDIKISVHRGQVGRSEVELADRWKWSRSKVRKFLKDLEEEQQIIQQKTNVTQLLTIKNYDEYQKKEQQDIHQEDTSRTPIEHQKNIYKNDKKENKVENEKKTNSSEPPKVAPSNNLEFNYTNGLFEKEIPETWLQVWIDAYPAVDILSEIKKAKAWLFANPKKRKKDHKAFLNNWLARCQKNGGNIASNKPHNPHNPF